MDNRALKKSQVIVELVLAFIIIAVLFIGGFKIWAGLENTLIRETTSYQDERVESGSKAITRSTEDIISAEFDEVNPAEMQEIVDIQLCECIDDRLKDRLIGIYTEIYENEIKMNSYEDVVENLKDSLAAMQQAWDVIPWCNRCCLCKIYCYSYSEGERTRYTVWRICGGSADNPCKTCRKCRRYIRGDCGNLLCPGDSRSREFPRTCRAMKKNMDDEHSQYRQMLEEYMDDTEDDLDEAQAEYLKAKRSKERAERRLDRYLPEAACCNLD